MLDKMLRSQFIHYLNTTKHHKNKIMLSRTSFSLHVWGTHGFGGLGVACWPLVPKFMGSNLAEAVGFLRAKKSSARLPSEGK